MNLGELRNFVYSNLGGEDNVDYDANMAVVHINRHVNQALDEISSEHDWPWLDAVETINTVAGTAGYTPVATWLRTKQVRIAEEYPMRLVTLADLETQWPSSDRGMPGIFTIFASQIVFRPIPDAVYVVTHRYTRTEVDLSTDSDTPLMPAQFHSAIVARATVLAARRLGRWQLANVHTPDVERWSKLMRDDQRRSRGAVRVKVRPGVWQDV